MWDTLVVALKHNIKSGRMDYAYSKVPTVSVPLKETMALLLAKMGFQREKAMAIRVEVMTEAIGTTGRGQGALAAALPIVVEAMTMVENEVLARLPRTTCKGVVKPYLTLTEGVTV